MAYLAKDDYSLRISVENLDEIIAQGILSTGITADNFRSNAESWAMALVKFYVASQFNISGEYALNAPAARNSIIMQLTIDLALCSMHKTINPRDIPEHIAIACDNAIKTLEEIRDGKGFIDIPPATTDPLPLQTSFIDSQIKFISKPYQDESLFDETTAVP